MEIKVKLKHRNCRNKIEISANARPTISKNLVIFFTNFFVFNTDLIISRNVRIDINIIHNKLIFNKKIN